MKKIASSLVILVALCFGCDESKDGLIATNVNMMVNSYTRECTGVDTRQCMLVQEGDLIGTDTWYNFYNSIEGFTYEPGYIYSLVVAKRRADNPPADGSSITYHLQKLVSKKKV